MMKLSPIVEHYNDHTFTNLIINYNIHSNCPLLGLTTQNSMHMGSLYIGNNSYNKLQLVPNFLQILAQKSFLQTTTHKLQETIIASIKH